MVTGKNIKARNFFSFSLFFAVLTRRIPVVSSMYRPRPEMKAFFFASSLVIIDLNTPN